MTNKKKRDISRKIMVSYLQASIGSNAAAAVAFGFTVGVLAALLNTKMATEGTDVGNAVTASLAANVSVSWSIAAFFCLPQIINRTFNKFDSFMSSLQIIGWPARRYLFMLVTQLLGILLLSISISYPVAVFFQKFVMHLTRRDSDDLLYPSEYFQPITLHNLAVAMSVISCSSIIICALVFRKYAFKKYYSITESKTVKVTIERGSRVKWIDIIAIAAIFFFVLATKSGSQAGIFTIISMVLSLFWLENRSALFVVRFLEKKLTRFSKVSPAIAMIGAFSAELHPATKAIFLPLCYVLGIPAIVLSVSRTEVKAVNQVGEGIQNWDFLIMLGLPLFFVGTLSVSSFLMAADQIMITTELFRKIGASVFMINSTRFIGLPLFYLCLAMFLSATFAAISSVLHLVILKQSLTYMFAGISLKVSLMLAFPLYIFFLASGLIYLIWKTLRTNYSEK
ncbi:hypothetical protein EML15_07980 [Corynebacterium sp. sy017]|uniref:hypothetical protein n=1 Tax=unclassified Corynebacterium TaxID=2624378 RepID=UPI001186039A|nr:MULTISPECIES: hypothetical protein [unclassified Corynebacterium]MBP3089081.1 hypothetical protein [Corynebacterium sp. sy017]TSD91396.1 hypothetical protein ELY17_07990 [Corynebacterium sp. SY003]